MGVDHTLAHLEQFQADNPAARIQQIIDAIDVLATSPLIGLPGTAGKRELVIGRASHGYVALYSYLAEPDTVFVLAIRSQREAAYAGD